MGKSKKSKGGGANKAAGSTKKCTCDHPYKCDCGNRPDRPSKGHKWDPETQAWGGKGHKQKGGSGQTSSVAEKSTTTAVGKTVIEQWQRLPCQLLQDFCQRQRRPRAKFKNLQSGKKDYKFRCIVPDVKDDKKDMFFVPNTAVLNEEQAKQEAALLALLHLTPSLPHERKLPEPYKTTWLHAIDMQKKKKTQGTKKDQTVARPTKTTTGSNNTKGIDLPLTASRGASGKGSGGAKASTNLAMTKVYNSLSEKRKIQNEKKRVRNEKIRRHENIRLANQDHPVFMSAHIRKQIESLLRGDSINLQEMNDDDEDEVDSGDALEEVQVYVEERLHKEGFTRRQTRSAYREASKLKSFDAVSEEQWDSVYDECLQWLLIHLDEDELPEGFDPRGGTLDVVLAPTAARKNDTKTTVNDPKVVTECMPFASNYGIPVSESILIRETARQQKCSEEDVLWNALLSASNVVLEGGASRDGVNEVAREEIEALEAIFSSECAAASNDGLTTVSIPVGNEGADDLLLTVVTQDGAYPASWPARVLISGKWPSLVGTAIHINLIKFIATLELGEPMIFEIHGHVQELFQSTNEKISLIPFLTPGRKEKLVVKQSDEQMEKESDLSRRDKDKAKSSTPPPKVRRPRQRGHFWSTPPLKTPAAVAFPEISSEMETTRKSLPAAKARADFLALIKNKAGKRVILVEGDTGCGKTTQIPQFILEESPNVAKIVVAQPRRLAATGVASRVAIERGEKQPGVDSVGYVVRGDSAMSKKTRLVFCTTGVLIRQLQCEGALECVTHIVVDEVHERHLDTDILLGLLKNILTTHKSLRVILMSATLDVDRFAAYWGNDTPRMHIPGRTFPVVDYMLEDVLSVTGYIPPKKRKGNKGVGNQVQRKALSPWADSEMSDEEILEEETGEDSAENGNNGTSGGNSIDKIPIEELLKRVDETSVDYDLLGRLVKHLVWNKDPAVDDGSILVFLPGAPEINRAMDAIRRCTNSLPILLLPLHGGLQPKDQNIVFRPPGAGLTKVIVSTNVAETSVTIPDCTVVIDSAREKQSSYDPVNRMPLLLEQFACRASLKQRRGRAGRVRKGTCYKLISRKTYSRLPEHGEPEIRRCALDQTLLSLLFLGVERGPGTFMRTLLDPPSVKSMDAATFSLLKLGAVKKVGTNGNLSLTPLGMHLAGIPAPPAVGKMLVMGSVLGCRTPALAMAAGISVGRSPFLRIDGLRKKRYNRDEEPTFEEIKQERILEERDALFKTVGNSDHALLAAAFMKWQCTSSGGGARKRILDSLGLSYTGMREMLQLVNQLSSSLAQIGYSESIESDRNSQSWRIIRTCAVSAMAPTQFVKVIRPATTYHETAEGAKEKDGEARKLKFFVRTKQESPEITEVCRSQLSRSQEERVFIHPSSANFGTGSYNCPWLVYNSMVRTSKPFLRDVTECSAYAMLMFGGELEVAAAEGVITIDGWVRLSGKARVVAMIRRLREQMDEQLTRKVDDPAFDIAATKEMKLIVKLITTDGLGT